MKFTVANFFRLPIDSTHSDIFVTHDTNFKLGLNAQLKRIFPYNHIKCESLRSVNWGNDRISFEISDELVSGRDFNYVVFEEVSDYITPRDYSVLDCKAFFITSISEGNGMNLCHVEGKVDVVFECYDKIESTTDQYSPFNDIKNHQVIEGLVVDVCDGQRWQYFDDLMATKSYQVLDNSHIGRYDNEIAIPKGEMLWALVSINEKRENLVSSVEISKFGAPFQDGVYCFIPYGYWNGERFTQPRVLTSDGKNVAMFNYNLINTEYVDSIRFTYNVPFFYEIQSDDGVAPAFVVLGTPVCVGDLTVTLDDSKVINVISGNPILSNSANDDDTHISEITLDLGIVNIVSEIDNYISYEPATDGIYSPTNNLAEHQLNVYPFKKWFLQLGSKEIPLDFGSLITKLRILATPTPHGTLINIHLETVKGKIFDQNAVYDICEMQGYARLHKDSIDSYVRNNYNSIVKSIEYKDKIDLISYSQSKLTGGANLGNNLIALLQRFINFDAMGFAKTAVNTPIQFVNDVYSGMKIFEENEAYTDLHIARGRDVNNKADVVTTPSSSAILNSATQDCIRVFYKTPLKEDSAVKQTLHNFNAFGSSKNEYIKLPLDESKENRFFNFIKIDDAKFPNIFNRSYRTQMESIFNNGTRIWYIDRFPDEGTEALIMLPYLMELNSQINNPLNSIVEANK